jgi:hypothetical protein
MIEWSTDAPPSEKSTSHRRYIQKRSSRAQSDDHAGSGCSQRDRSFGQRAGRRDYVVDQPDALWEAPSTTRAKCTANIAASLAPIEARLAGRVSGAAKCDGIERNLDFTRQGSSDLRGRVEAAPSKSAGMERDGHDQVRRRTRRPGRSLVEHRSHNRCRHGVQPPQSPLRVLESVNPLSACTFEPGCSHARRQWRAGHSAARTEVAAEPRRHFLA